MRYLLLIVLLAAITPPPSVSIALEPQGALMTVWLYNTDTRYSDFVLHIAGKPDMQIHAIAGEIDTVSLPFCGQFDMTAEATADPPVPIGHYVAAVRCRKFYVSFP